MQKMSTKNMPEAKAQRRMNKKYDAAEFPSLYVTIQKIGTTQTKLVSLDKAHRLSNPQIKMTKTSMFIVQPQWAIIDSSSSAETFKGIPIEDLKDA
jgi:hypothetical protein